MTAAEVEQVPAFRCPGPEARPLPHGLVAWLIRRVCAAAADDSCLELCDPCWAARRAAS